MARRAVSAARPPTRPAAGPVAADRPRAQQPTSPTAHVTAAGPPVRRQRYRRRTTTDTNDRY